MSVKKIFLYKKPGRLRLVNLMKLHHTFGYKNFKWDEVYSWVLDCLWFNNRRDGVTGPKVIQFDYDHLIIQLINYLIILITEPKFKPFLKISLKKTQIWLQYSIIGERK